MELVSTVYKPSGSKAYGVDSEMADLSDLEEARTIAVAWKHSPESCELSQALLARVTQLRDLLGEVERSLQEKHLRCCVFPQLPAPEAVVTSMEYLSRRHIGALIAIEREMSLEDFAESGVRLNAELSSSILLSIFYPGNPLHDGAVILRGNRVLAAGCILPLAADHAIFRAQGLGTRHRAGVGLSQVSDAIVFIVSEQTGKTSVALKGQLFHGAVLGEDRRDPRVGP